MKTKTMVTVTALLASPLCAAVSLGGIPKIALILQAAILFNPDLGASLGPIVTLLTPISTFASLIGQALGTMPGGSTLVMVFGTLLL